MFLARHAYCGVFTGTIHHWLRSVAPENARRAWMSMGRLVAGLLLWPVLLFLTLFVFFAVLMT